MKLPDPEQFKFKDCVIGGDDCWLITPNDIKARWDETNLNFRSIIIRKSDHYVVNCSFFKFFNFAEKPDLLPFPVGEAFEVIEKHDGSTLIIGSHNGELIHRTRGTVNAEQLDNGHEIALLKEKYPRVFAAALEDPDYTILTEWETPNNVIVIRRVQEPTLTLIGIINNRTLEYFSQTKLDLVAKALKVERPKRFKFDSIEECIEEVTEWRSGEGVVLYSLDGQNLRKIKASLYCELHKLMSGLKNVNNVLDVFMESPRFATVKEFYDYMSLFLDFEIAERCKPFIEEIIPAYIEALAKIEKAQDFVETIKTGFSRKEQAIEIQSHWKDWRVSLGFQILDNKELDDKILRRAIEGELLLVKNNSV